MVRVFVPLSSRHCKYASLAPVGRKRNVSGKGILLSKGLPERCILALVGEGGVSPGMHTFCKRTAHPCMPFLAK